MKAMRLLLALALAITAISSLPVQAQYAGPGQNTKCGGDCKLVLDQCSAAPNRIMTLALKETTPYNIGTRIRQKADIKFEGAFLAAEKCWDSYYRCTDRCVPRHCIDACQATLTQCFAAGDRLAREGLQEMKRLKYNSPEWQAANTKGDAETDKCLEDNRSCQAKCANP
jgi:hypothetical protein